MKYIEFQITFFPSYSSGINFIKDCHLKIKRHLQIQ
jgi:hypothetical protein